MTTQNTFYSWRTNKVSNGFKAVVTKNTSRNEPNKQGHYVDSEIVKEVILKTRARAKTHGQKWVKYLKATA